MPRKVPAWPGLGGRGLATIDPSPLLSWLLWDQGWLSGRLHVHFCLEDYISTLGHGVWGFEPWGPALRCTGPLLNACLTQAFLGGKVLFLGPDWEP